MSERRRKLRGLASLIGPYRGRAWLTLGAMLVAVAAGLHFAAVAVAVS